MTAINYSKERYWDEVEIGDRLPSISLMLDATAMVLQVSGSQDWSLVHHDLEFANDSGIPNIFYNTGWTTALLGRLLTDWMGPSGWVQTMNFQMRGMNAHGTRCTAHGTVTGKRTESNHALVDVEIVLENDPGGVTTPGTATIRLPRK
jgi:acyl dehydratase